jgi:arabinofuranan 3-O-arabinosyltransferase
VLATGTALLALCLAQSPGRTTADTKLDLAVDPAHLLGRVLHLWDPGAGFGQLQNQGQGYLFPMGPFFALARAVGLPAWTAQRLWIGLLLAVGFAGAVRLADELDIGTPATRLAGGLAYALSPYLVVLLGALSGLVLPAALTPWALIPLVRGSRSGSPVAAAARSGAAVALMGAVNAGTTVAAIALPALWLATRRPGPRRRALVRWWLAAVAMACAWWLGSVLVEGRYGFDFLRYIERARATTATDSVPEALRGTANWLAHYVFGGRPWWRGGWALVATPAAILGSAALAAAGLVGLTSPRLAERRFLVLSLLLGVTMTAAGYAGPLGGPLAGTVHRLLDGPLVVFRSVDKFGPLVALPLALGLAHTLSRLRLARRERPLTAVLVCLLVAATALPLLQGDLLPDGTFDRVPAYWSQAAGWLAAHSGGDRTLLLPASGFGDYRWGRTVDEPLQALARSPWAVRNQAPLGSVGLTRLLDAIDQRLVSGRSTPGLAAVLARSGVRYVLARNDLDWRRAGAPAPAQVRSVLDGAPGIRRVATFGPDLPATVSSGTATGGPYAAIDVYQVDGAIQRVEAYPAAGTTVLSGGPESLLQLGDRGALSGATVLAGDPLPAVATGPRKPAVASRPPGLATASGPSGPGLRWADTDGLQRRDLDFGLVHGAGSYVLTEDEAAPGGGAPEDRLPVEGTAHQTVAVMEGAAAVSASSYATAVAPHPEAQPMAAFDGDPATAWQSGAAVSSEGQWVELDLDRPRTVATVSVRLLDPAPGGPRPTRLRITTDAGEVERPVADTEQPQTLGVPTGPTRRLRVTLLGVVGDGGPASLVRAGLRDVVVPGLRVDRPLAVPGDELGRFSDPAAPPPLFAFDRSVADLGQVVRSDEEHALDRRFVVPRPARFDLGGTLRVGPGPELDDLVGSQFPGSTPPDVAPVELACGFGPEVRVDGTAIPTRASTTVGALRGGREVVFSACGTLDLDAGPHRLETAPGSPMAVVSASLTGEGWASAGPAGPARSTSIERWGTVHRVVTVGAGPSSVLAVDENLNAGWTATLDGHRLQAIRVDGWRQAWVVPAGAGGHIDLRFAPDHAYRAALGVGAIALLLLGVAAWAVRWRRGSALPPTGPDGRRRLLAPAGAAGLLLVGGPVALVAPAALLGAGRLLDARTGGRRGPARPERSVRPWRGDRLTATVAGGAFLVAGLVEAAHPARGPGSHAGAFGWAAQLAGLVALGAVATVLAGAPASSPGDRRRRLLPGRRGPRQEDGGQPRPAGDQAVETSGPPGDVVVGGAPQAHVHEPPGPQQPHQGPGGEQPQVPHHDAPGAPVHLPGADLGEHGLHAQEQEHPVEPGRQVGSGEQEGAARCQHPADLVEDEVRVHQVLDHLAHEDDVEGLRPEGQATSVHSGEDAGQPPPAGTGDRHVGPVEGDDAGAGDPVGRHRGDGAVAAPEVEDPGIGAPPTRHRLEQPQLHVDPVGAAGGAPVDPLVERPE